MMQLLRKMLLHIAQDPWSYFSFEYRLYFRFLLKVLRRNKIDTTETVCLLTVEVYSYKISFAQIIWQRLTCKYLMSNIVEFNL